MEKKLPPTQVRCLVRGVTLAWVPVSGNQVQNMHVPVDKAWKLRVHLVTLLYSLSGLGSRREKKGICCCCCSAPQPGHKVEPELWET